MRIALVDPGIPEVDLESIDLLDQDGDRLAGRTKLLALVGGEPGTPATEDLEPLLVEPIDHQSTLVHAARPIPSSARRSLRSLGHVSFPRGSRLGFRGASTLPRPLPIESGLPRDRSPRRRRRVELCAAARGPGGRDRRGRGCDDPRSRREHLPRLLHGVRRQPLRPRSRIRVGGGGGDGGEASGGTSRSRTGSPARQPSSSPGSCPGIEQLRFANSGTEATQAAVRLARAATGRELVIKFEGHYHGWADHLAAGIGAASAARPARPDSAGSPDRGDGLALDRAVERRRRARGGDRCGRAAPRRGHLRGRARLGRRARATSGIPRAARLLDTGCRRPRHLRRGDDGVPAGRRGRPGTLRRDARHHGSRQGHRRRHVGRGVRRVARPDALGGRQQGRPRWHVHRVAARARSVGGGSVADRRRPWALRRPRAALGSARGRDRGDLRLGGARRSCSARRLDVAAVSRRPSRRGAA